MTIQCRLKPSKQRKPNMTIIVTGAVNFIGSNIVKALNQRGITDIVAVDNLTKAKNSKTLPSAKSPTTSTNTNLSAK